MSIAVLTQVYDEVRRLAVAGSVVAAGDFRLRKLIPPLEQAGAKAPVFARIAQAAQTLVGAKEQESADALLSLATLVLAVLYTQGETGIAGPLEPIETVELGAPTTQASARVLKPLVEALTTTGSGRLELVRDAYERGAFRDLRLVLPALQALDDPYADIADFVADQVLPLYGKAILPQLRVRFDPKGHGGDARRLRLMHKLDPEGTSELVAQALESGSKEVKLAAISCLGSRVEDLRYLLEQTASKSREVRQAAYQALAALDAGDAVAALEKVLAGKDLDLAAGALKASRSERLVRAAIAAAEVEMAALPKTKDKKEAGARLGRLASLARGLGGRADSASQTFVIKLFSQREALAKVKGEPLSGADLNSAVVALMEQGPPELKRALAAAHASLPPEELSAAFWAARDVLPPEEVFEAFSPYLTAKVDEKRKQRDPAWARREALREELVIYGPLSGQPMEAKKTPPLDPRWLDLAVDLGWLDVVQSLGRPEHAATERFLSDTLKATLKASKSLNDCYNVVEAMAHVGHPDATDAFVTALNKHGGKTDPHTYWFARIIPMLPASAVPRIEALLSKLPDRVAEEFARYLHQLREKTS